MADFTIEIGHDVYGSLIRYVIITEPLLSAESQNTNSKQVVLNEVCDRIARNLSVRFQSIRQNGIATIVTNML